MHTQRGHARYLHRRGACFVLPVGGNQPALFDQLDALSWAEVPIGWMTYDRGHGRQEIRTIQVRPTPQTTVAGVRAPPSVAAMRETPPWALAGRSGHSDR